MKEKDWVVKLTYFDGQDMHVILPKEEVPKFLECYRDKKEYWAPHEKSGFMTDPSRVRAITFGEAVQQPDEETAAKVDKVAKTAEVFDSFDKNKEEDPKEPA